MKLLVSYEGLHFINDELRDAKPKKDKKSSAGSFKFNKTISTGNLITKHTKNTSFGDTKVSYTVKKSSSPIRSNLSRLWSKANQSTDSMVSQPRRQRGSDGRLKAAYPELLRESLDSFKKSTKTKGFFRKKLKQITTSADKKLKEYKKIQKLHKFNATASQFSSAKSKKTVGFGPYLGGLNNINNQFSATHTSFNSFSCQKNTTRRTKRNDQNHQKSSKNHLNELSLYKRRPKLDPKNLNFLFLGDEIQRLEKMKKLTISYAKNQKRYKGRMRKIGGFADKRLTDFSEIPSEVNSILKDAKKINKEFRMIARNLPVREFEFRKRVKPKIRFLSLTKNEKYCGLFYKTKLEDTSKYSFRKPKQDRKSMRKLRKTLKKKMF